MKSSVSTYSFYDFKKDDTLNKSLLICFQIFLLAITLMVAGSSAWPQWVQRLMSRDQIETMKEGSWKASPFSLGQHARARDQDVTKEELKFMAEFSRFMNYRIPHLLQV